MKKTALIFGIVILFVVLAISIFVYFFARKPAIPENKPSAFSELNINVSDLLAGFDPSSALSDTYVGYNPRMGDKVKVDERGLIHLFELTAVSSGIVYEETAVLSDSNKTSALFEILPVYFFNRKGEERKLDLIISIYIPNGDAKYAKNLSSSHISSFAPNISVEPGAGGLAKLFPKGTKITFVPYIDYGLNDNLEYIAACDSYLADRGGFSRFQEDFKNYIYSGLSENFNGKVPLLYLSRSDTTND